MRADSGESVTVPAGSIGVVVSENRPADWYEIEIDAGAVGHEPGRPWAFVEASVAQLRVIRRHRVRVA